MLNWSGGDQSLCGQYFLPVYRLSLQLLDPQREILHKPSPANVPGSTVLLVCCLPACSGVVPQGMPGPAVHTLLPLSKSPTTPPPSPTLVPHISLPAYPAPLQVLSDNAPTGSLDGSVRHRLAAGLRTRPLPLLASSLLVLQTTRGCTSPSDTPPSYHSIHTKPAPAPPPAAPLASLSPSSAPPPALQLVLPTPCACTRTPVSD